MISSSGSFFGVGTGLAGGADGVGRGIETGGRGMDAVFVSGEGCGGGGGGTCAVSGRLWVPQPARHSRKTKTTANWSGFSP